MFYKFTLLACGTKDWTGSCYWLVAGCYIQPTVWEHWRTNIVSLSVSFVRCLGLWNQLPCVQEIKLLV